MSLARAAAIREVLDTPVRWHTLRHEPVVGSTNDVAIDALRGGETPGLVVVADRQTAGRGRRGRTWIDDVDVATGPANLAVTATCQATRNAGMTPLAVGLAVADVFASSGARPRLKWPNDVLLGDRKAAGILIERHRIAEADLLLIGCGLDLDWRGLERDESSAAWVSLAEVLDADVDRAGVLAGYLRRLDHWLTILDRDPAAVVSEYRRRCATLGSPVHVSLPDGDSLRGDAVDIDEQGRLVVEGARGRTVVTAGEITHARSF